MATTLIRPEQCDLTRDWVFETPISGATSLWWYTKCLEAINVSPGASGATFTPPDANTLGGYQLDVATEYLYWGCHVHTHWDAASDLETKITFEVNVDNTEGGDGDTVDLVVVCNYKGDAETAIKTQTIEVATVVGKSAQFKQFVATFTLNYDLVDHVVQVGDKIAFRVNLETDTSEVDDVIINHIIFRYKTAKMDPEV